MLTKMLTKPSLILGSEYMLIFVKGKKDTYTFFFFLLFKPVHQHALGRQLFKLKEWWNDIFNTPTIPRLRGMSPNPSTVSFFI